MTSQNACLLHIVKHLLAQMDNVITPQDADKFVQILGVIVAEMQGIGHEKHLQSAVTELINEGRRQCQAVAEEGEELIGLLHDETDAALQQIRQAKQRRVNANNPHAKPILNQTVFPIKL